MLKKYLEYPSVFFAGGIIYMIMEIIWRGFTHWSMGLCGGLCFLEIYLIEKHLKDIGLITKCILGSVFITGNEFITGCLVNILLGWNVWDYSNVPLNIVGQVCLLFSFLWFLLCFPAFFIAKKIQHFYSKTTPYKKNALQ